MTAAEQRFLATVLVAIAELPEAARLDAIALAFRTAVDTGLLEESPLSPLHAAVGSAVLKAAERRSR